jgi:hypothetical protein
MEAREFQSHRVFVAWLAGPLAANQFRQLLFLLR